VLKERLSISRKMETQDAVIALDKGKFAGFVISKVGNMASLYFGCDRSSDYRNLGLAKKIKSFVFDYSLKNIQKQSFRNYNRLSSNENKF
jgi:hypothetical protein